METNLKNNILEFVNLGKAYQTSTTSFTVVRDFNLKVSEYEFVSIIGHSGCGKSTILSMAAGLNSITSGVIKLNGSPIQKPGLDRGVVFQSPNLLPWLTVLENVMLGVNQSAPELSQNSKIERCIHYLSKVGLEKEIKKKASELSQGTKQRVGIARAFAIKPKILLLDEPFGMLDSLTRIELQDVLLEIWNEEHITAILVSHDVDEAILMSDRLILMTNGPSAKVGKIVNVPFERPRQREKLTGNSAYYELRDQVFNFLEQ